MIEQRQRQKEVSNRPWYLALLVVICSVMYQDYWGYSREWHQIPDLWMNRVRGLSPAPFQYRIGIIRLSFWMSRSFHFGMRHAFTLIDFAACALAVFLLYSLLQRLMADIGVSRSGHLFCNAGFVALVAAYLPWTLVTHQQPETLPSLLFVAATLFLLTYPPGGRVGKVFAAFLLLLLAAGQGWVRADDACLMHAGVFCVCLMGGSSFAFGRWKQAGVSAVAALLAGGTQLYIMHHLYPHATYAGPVVQAFSNLSSATSFIPFLIFMLPVVLTWAAAARRFRATSTPERIVVVSSVLYLVAWFAVGLIYEVRIFLPFALAMSPWMLIRFQDWINRDAQILEKVGV